MRWQDRPTAFGEAAASYSACSSARDGGRLGQVSCGQTTEAFEAALKTMRAGEVTRTPVATRYGFHVIALDRAEPGRALAFEHVKGRIAGWLEAASWVAGGGAVRRPAGGFREDHRRVSGDIGRAAGAVVAVPIQGRVAAQSSPPG